MASRGKTLQIFTLRSSLPVANSSLEKSKNDCQHFAGSLTVPQVSTYLSCALKDNSSSRSRVSQISTWPLPVPTASIEESPEKATQVELDCWFRGYAHRSSIQGLRLRWLAGRAMNGSVDPKSTVFCLHDETQLKIHKQWSVPCAPDTSSEPSGEKATQDMAAE